MTSSDTSVPLVEAAHSESHTLGAWLVFASAVSWSTGGIISRLADVDNPWNTVFWRSGSAMLLLLAFMLVRDGRRGTLELFRGMGWAGMAVAMCFAIASTSFIVALQFTTVANILLMQAGVPLIAALISRIVFGEPLRPSTWIAIGAVIFGVAVMVSDSFNGKVSPIGDGLALVISFAFALATVITRRYSHIRMTPAVTTGVGIAWVVSIFMSMASVGGVMVEAWQLPLLFVFGATLALGLALRLGVTPYRIAGLALIGLAVAKALLIDASGLTGLLRVGAFLGLGLSLAGLAWLNTWVSARMAGAGNPGP